jgi:hypothetical protein
MSKLTRKYLKTLKRIPDDVVLSVASRNLKLDDGNYCLVGTAVKEMLISMVGTAPKKFDTEVDSINVPELASLLFGGTKSEWEDVFTGVIDTHPLGIWEKGYDPKHPDMTRSQYIELAFLKRVAQAAEA